MSNLTLIFHPNDQTLQGSFSAVSTPHFARKYSLESSWRDLQDLHAFAPLRLQYFRNISSKLFAFYGKKLQNSTQKMKKFGNSPHVFIREKILTIFGWNFEIWAVQKYVGSFLPKTHKCKSCKSRQEFSNGYLLAKIGVDTAENGPFKDGVPHRSCQDHDRSAAWSILAY